MRGESLSEEIGRAGSERVTWHENTAENGRGEHRTFCEDIDKTCACLSLIFLQRFLCRHNVMYNR